jgi:hypothetical protein
MKLFKPRRVTCTMTSTNPASLKGRLIILSNGTEMRITKQVGVTLTLKPVRWYHRLASFLKRMLRQCWASVCKPETEEEWWDRQW